MPINLLPVKHIQQEERAGCLAAVAAMYLDFLGISIAQSSLYRLFGTTEFGAVRFKLARAERYGARVIFGKNDEAALLHHLLNGQSVVLFVMTDELPYWDELTQHALLIIGYQAGTYFVNDPAFPTGPISVFEEDLMLAWSEFDYAYAIVTR